MRILTRAVAALAVLAATACALSASPADSLQHFQAPPGWRSSPGILGFMQFWRPPSNDREVLMLFKSPKPLKAADVFSNAQFDDNWKDVVFEKHAVIQICGGAPATYVEARGTSSKGGDERVEIVLATRNATSYLAMYARPLEGQANPTAQAALRELCPKQ